MNDCEYCGKPVAPPLPIHKVCALVWVIKEHEKHPPSGDWAILVSAKDLKEAQARVDGEKK